MAEDVGKGARGKANKAAGQGANRKGTELLEGLAKSHSISNDTDAHGTDWSEPLLIPHRGSEKAHGAGAGWAARHLNMSCWHVHF